MEEFNDSEYENNPENKLSPGRRKALAEEDLDK